MIEQVKTNWAKALAEVGASIIGTLGVVYLIAYVVSQQRDDLDPDTSFSQYFHAGQISLPILSLSGIIFVALFRRYSALNPITTVVLYVVFLGPIIATAFIVGLNPGFQANVLPTSTLSLLWLFYWTLHGVWFLVLVLEPSVPSPQEAATAQEDRVNEIKAGATGRA